MDERGGKAPLVARIRFSSPPLPLPPERCALVRVWMSGAESLNGPDDVLSPGKGGLGPPFVFASRRTIAVKTAACVSREAPCARAGRSDLSNLRRWMGAPFADDGLKCEGMSSWPRFSRTRFSQESVERDSAVGSLPEKERRNCSPIRRPPSPPHGSARQRLGAGTSRLVRTHETEFGCLRRKFSTVREKQNAKMKGQFEKRELIQPEGYFDRHLHSHNLAIGSSRGLELPSAHGLDGLLPE